MEKDIINYNHSINIIERKNIFITGVKKVESFDKEEFLLETVMGYLALKGNELEMIKLDTKDGSVTIKGFINSFDYLEDTINEKKDNSFLKKLFK